jgi:hypothetical protein
MKKGRAGQIPGHAEVAGKKATRISAAAPAHLLPRQIVGDSPSMS